MTHSGMTLPPAEEAIRRAHALEWQEGFQYAVTFRIIRNLSPEQVEEAKLKPPAELLVRPPGNGWNRNTHVAKDAYRASPPDWCKDGTALIQRVYWYRHMEGMKPYSSKHRISVFRGDQ